MKSIIRTVVASFLAFGLFAVSGLVGANPTDDTQDGDPFLQQIMTDYDS